jgi:hypothetical protein
MCFPEIFKMVKLSLLVLSIILNVSVFAQDAGSGFQVRNLAKQVVRKIRIGPLFKKITFWDLSHH